MLKNSLVLVALLLMGAPQPLLSQTSCSDAGSNLQKITIHTYNHAGLSSRLLTEAKKEASSILQAAGVEVKWVACPEMDKGQAANADCLRRLRPSELVLNIMPHQTRTSLRLGDTFAYALLFTNGQFGHYAYLFTDRIEDFAGVNGSAGQLLGGVMAHEIGHLLLASPGHTSKGLMSARWDQDDLGRLSQGQLRFSPGQAEQLRAGAQARCNELQQK